MSTVSTNKTQSYRILGLFFWGLLFSYSVTVAPLIPTENNFKKKVPSKKENSLFQKKATKPSYKISAALRGEFDDNFLNANQQIRSRFRMSFEPGVEWSKKWKTGDVRAKYEFGLSYYENRKSKPIDDFHQGRRI